MHYLRDNNVCNPNEMRNYVAQIDEMFWNFEWKMKYSDPTQIVRPDTTFIFGHKSDANPERIPAAICLPLTLFSQKSPNPIYLTQTLGRTRRFKARQILSDSENVRGRTFWLTNFSKSATSKNLFICSKPLMCRLPTTLIPVPITQHRVRIRFYNISLLYYVDLCVLSSPAPSPLFSTGLRIKKCFSRYAPTAPSHVLNHSVQIPIGCLL